MSLLVTVESDEGREEEIVVLRPPAPPPKEHVPTTPRFNRSPSPPWYPVIGDEHDRRFWSSMVRLQKGVIINLPRGGYKLEVLKTYENGAGAIVRYLNPPKRRVARKVSIGKHKKLKTTVEVEVNEVNTPWLISLYVNRDLVNFTIYKGRVINHVEEEEEVVHPTWGEEEEMQQEEEDQQEEIIIDLSNV